MSKLKCIDLPKKECTGCRMCHDICPKSAITFKEDKCGFFYPTINNELCIDCGLCYQKCPVINITQQKETNYDYPLCFAFESKDEELVRNSSSGGAFSTIAEWVLEQGGIVCGARYNYEQNKVEHIAIFNKDGLSQLRTSKYVQSDASNIYSTIKKAIKQDQYVLFSGCPCQVAALKSFLGTDNNDKLILIDITCHGVPSQKVFDKYVESINKDSGLNRVNFREKKQYGWTPTMLLQFKDGQEYYRPKWESDYYKVFLNGIGCRLSCGNCHFNKLPRQGDLTLADFWDIGKYDEDFKDSLGVSLVLFNNLKHLYLVDALRNAAKRFKPKNLEIEKATNGNIFKSSATNKARTRFFNLLDKYDFETAYSRTANRYFEIGLVGWWYGRNYGSFLTYFALNRYLTQKGYDVLMLSWPYHSKPFPPKQNDYIQHLIDEYYEYSIDRTFEEYPDVNRYCDVFMIGSDQMWNYWDQKNMGYYYFLDFVDDNHPKISYSTSFGHAKYLAPQVNTDIQRVLLKRFSNISVREVDGVNICKNIFNIDVTRTIDPVFLVNNSYFEDLIKKDPATHNKPYLFCYILTPSAEKGQLLKQIANKLGLDLVIALDGQTDLEENRKKLGINNVLMNLNVSQWLSYIKNADHIITDSFHGVCFSIIFRKQFSCMVNKERGSSRFETLLGSVLHLDDLMFEDFNDILQSDCNKKIDYEAVYNIIDKEVEFSSKWLESALNEAFKNRK